MKPIKEIMEMTQHTKSRQRRNRNRPTLMKNVIDTSGNFSNTSNNNGQLLNNLPPELTNMNVPDMQAPPAPNHQPPNPNLKKITGTSGASVKRAEAKFEKLRVELDMTYGSLVGSVQMFAVMRQSQPLVNDANLLAALHDDYIESLIGLARRYTWFYNALVAMLEASVWTAFIAVHAQLAVGIANNHGFNPFMPKVEEAVPVAQQVPIEVTQNGNMGL